MRLRAALAGLFLALLALSGYLAYQGSLVPVPLSDGRELYVLANPEFGEEAARLEALLPAGPGLESFLATQSDLTLIEPALGGTWAGQLATELRLARHGRRWRVTLRTGWPLQDGTNLDAHRVAAALGPEVQRLGGELRVSDPATLEFRFRVRPADPLGWLSRWRVPGTGPFFRKGHTLVRFDGFLHGRAGLAALTVVTDPALLESHAWAEGLSSRRWAWAAFPGKVAPEDMAKVRLAPYDEIHLKDGSVWFLSRRMRRLRPNLNDWTRTRLFGVWSGAMDLPYDPLGM
jgi:hypothetical protein